jgi:hypothetical protein
VDLVDEQHVARFEAGQDGREVAGPFDGRPGGGPELGSDLGGHDRREGGLAEPGCPGEQHVVGGLTAVAGPGEDQLELAADPFLADELLQPRGPQAGLQAVLAGQRAGVEHVLGAGAGVVGAVHARAPSKAAAPR